MRLIGPIRRPLRLVASIGEGALEVALALVREARSALEDQQPATPAPEPTSVTVERPAPRPAARPRSRPASRLPRSARSEPAQPPPAPPLPDTAKTIDDEPVPVAEFGGQGAEEDAGPEVHVDPPWDGYDAMTVADIKARLADANRELLAAVALYEGFGRGRRSVTDTAEQRLTRLSAPRS